MQWQKLSTYTCNLSFTSVEGTLAPNRPVFTFNLSVLSQLCVMNTTAAQLSLHFCRLTASSGWGTDRKCRASSWAERAASFAPPLFKPFKHRLQMRATCIVHPFCAFTLCIVPLGAQIRMLDTRSLMGAKINRRWRRSKRRALHCV